MNHGIKKCLGLIALGTLYAHAQDSCCGCAAPHVSFRSQSENAARELAGWTDHVNLHDMKSYYGSFSIIPEYTRSFRPYDINKALFGDSLYDCKRIKITGSDVATRNAKKDWAAENFYLSDKFEGEISLKPRVQNFLVDFNFYFGLDQWLQGLYTRVHAPVVWSKWDLNAQERVKNDGITDGTKGYLDLWKNTSGLLTRFFDYSCDEMVTSTQWNTSTNDVRTAYPLTCAKICPCSKRKAAVSDIQADLGWNFTRPKYHWGVFVRTALPTGTRPDGEYLFEPVIGNGKHFELGGGATGHVIMWESNDTERNIGMYIDANLTHMFKTRQRRVFDLKNYGPLSRYIPVFKYSSSDEIEDPFIMTPAANLTCQDVNVSVGIQADIALMFTYASKNATWDLGYNFWARSCEKIDCCPLCECKECDLGLELDGKTWAPAATNLTINTIPTHGTQPETQLSFDDLDICGARTRGLSHKVFTHIGYSWLDHGDWIPYIGIGAEGEFGQQSGRSESCSSSCCSNDCNDCDNSCSCCSIALSQWGIWVKGGVSF